MNGLTATLTGNGLIDIKKDGETIHLIPEDVFKAIRSPTFAPHHMDIKDFCDEGYLHEVNRQVLHPLGLALEVTSQDDGPAFISGVWDYRKDPEGIIFDGDSLNPAKAANVERLLAERAPIRTAALGYVVQPSHSKESTP